MDDRTLLAIMSAILREQCASRPAAVSAALDLLREVDDALRREEQYAQDAAARRSEIEADGERFRQQRAAAFATHQPRSGWARTPGTWYHYVTQPTPETVEYACDVRAVGLVPPSRIKWCDAIPEQHLTRMCEACLASDLWS